MGNQDSPPTSNTLHQFLNLDSISNQSLNTFAADFRDNAYHHSLPSIEERMSRSINLVQVDSTTPNEAQSTQLVETSNETCAPTQKLALSLGSWMQTPLTSNLMNPIYSCNPPQYSMSDRCFPSSSSSASQYQLSSNLYGTESYLIAIGESKYLKPAQALVEEAVSVGEKSVYLSNEKNIRKLSPTDNKGSIGLCSELRSELFNSVLSLEKQELEAKLAKLISLLEEVERRFEQYYHHLEEVVSCFELIAGLGAGKSYTALALEAMSRHFCSLKDAIIYQICAARRKHMPRINMGLSQLSLIDQENRASLQHLGMTRQTWRPIRGLPENSVTILRSWLFQHFLHPYPNDSEKLLLASQTGLSKNQVSNWFINARVRLWKPMIEEMYKEEFGDDDDSVNPVLLDSNSISKERITDDVDEPSI